MQLSPSFLHLLGLLSFYHLTLASVSEAPFNPRSFEKQIATCKSVNRAEGKDVDIDIRASFSFLQVFLFARDSGSSFSRVKRWRRKKEGATGLTGHGASLSFTRSRCILRAMGCSSPRVHSPTLRSSETNKSVMKSILESLPPSLSLARSPYARTHRLCRHQPGSGTDYAPRTWMAQSLE